MKFDEIFNKIRYSQNSLSNHSMYFKKMINYNVQQDSDSDSYSDSEIEIQTPKTIIKQIIKENGKEYLLLRFIRNTVSKEFYDQLLLLEEYHKKSTKADSIKSLILEDTLTVKVPIRYSKPYIKIIKEPGAEPFNYYHLATGMKVICKLGGNSIWIDHNNNANYNLIVKEISIIT